MKRKKSNHNSLSLSDDSASVASIEQESDSDVEFEVESDSDRQMICMICHKSNDPKKLLLCDGCENACHTKCDSPPLRLVPEGDWFCKECRTVKKSAEFDALESNISPNSKIVGLKTEIGTPTNKLARKKRKLSQPSSNSLSESELKAKVVLSELIPDSLPNWDQYSKMGLPCLEHFFINVCNRRRHSSADLISIFGVTIKSFKQFVSNHPKKHITFTYLQNFENEEEEDFARIISLIRLYCAWSELDLVERFQERISKDDYMLEELASNVEYVTLEMLRDFVDFSLPLDSRLPLDLSIERALERDDISNIQPEILFTLSPASASRDATVSKYSSLSPANMSQIFHLILELRNLSKAQVAEILDVGYSNLSVVVSKSHIPGKNQGTWEKIASWEASYEVLLRDWLKKYFEVENYVEQVKKVVSLNEEIVMSWINNLDTEIPFHEELCIVKEIGELRETVLNLDRRSRLERRCKRLKGLESNPLEENTLNQIKDIDLLSLRKPTRPARNNNTKKSSTVSHTVALGELSPPWKLKRISLVSNFWFNKETDMYF